MCAVWLSIEGCSRDESPFSSFYGLLEIIPYLKEESTQKYPFFGGEVSETLPLKSRTNLPDVLFKAFALLRQVYPYASQVLRVALALDEPCFFHPPEDEGDSRGFELQGFGDFLLCPSVLFPEKLENRWLSAIEPNGREELMVPYKVVPYDFPEKCVQRLFVLVKHQEVLFI
jgi:hypothetical protein